MNKKSIVVTSVVTSIVCFVVFLALAGFMITNQPDFLMSYISPQEETVINNNDKETFSGNGVAEESRIIDIVENTNPAVVSIVITKDVPVIEDFFFNPFGDDFFQDFFGGGFGFPFQEQQPRENETERREVGGGSGFFISSDGLIVTNRHVVDEPNADYTVMLNDGSKYDAEILAKDNVLDIAVLKIDSNEEFTYLEFGDSDALKPGQTVIAIGNALAEFRNSVSVGVVSGLSRSIVAGDALGRTELLEGVIQTDAAITPGNSGGPLLDLSGKVIGVNVAMQQAAQNIGFALPGNIVNDIVESVKEHGEIIHPYLGIRYIAITESLQQANNLPVDYGVLIQRGQTAEELAVIPDSPAAKAGLAENDIILEIDGNKIDQETSLASVIRRKSIGQTIELKILRDYEEMTVEVTLEKAPDNF